MLEQQKVSEHDFVLVSQLMLYVDNPRLYISSKGCLHDGHQEAKDEHVYRHC